jgi:hypothetical protein
MKTQADIEKLAAQYAYDILTTPESTLDIEDVINAWKNGEYHKDSFVWCYFEDLDPKEYYELFTMFKVSFLSFAEIISEKNLTSLKSGV